MTINDIKHPKIKAWVEEVAKMCQPDDIYVCDYFNGRIRKLSIN